MKKRMIIILIILVGLQHILAGDEGPHGGDSYAYEFSLLASHLADLGQVRDIKNIRKLIPEVRVYSDDPEVVQVNGQEVDAINYPSQKMIIVNRKRWREKKIKEKLVLVLHEYFGISGRELDTFEVSHQYDREVFRVSSYLLENKPEDLSYYSFERAYRPLYETRDSCSLNLSKVSEAVEKAKENALKKCEGETGLLCYVNQTEMSTRYSQRVPGVSYCEIEVLARIKS